MIQKSHTFYSFQKKSSKDCIIEMVGPPGVGKSYLCDLLKQNYKAKKKFFTKDRFNFELSDFEKQLLSKVYKNDLLKESYSFHTKSRINKLFSLIEQERIISNYNGIKLWDEGFVYYYKHYLRENLLDFPETVDTIFKKRLIINIVDEPENIYKKVKLREKQTGRLHISHKINDKQQIIQNTKRIIQKNFDFIEMFEHRYPNQVFTFNSSDNYEKQFNMLCAFLDSKMD